MRDGLPRSRHLSQTREFDFRAGVAPVECPEDDLGFDLPVIPDDHCRLKRIHDERFVQVWAARCVMNATPHQHVIEDWLRNSWGLEAEMLGVGEGLLRLDQAWLVAHAHDLSLIGLAGRLSQDGGLPHPVYIFCLKELLYCHKSDLMFIFSLTQEVT